jgi:hypothetical protein
MILGGLAASASEQEAALVEVSWLSRSLFDFRVGRAS